MPHSLTSTLFREFSELVPRPAQKAQKGRPNSQASGGKKRTGATGVGSQDISKENVLGEERRRRWFPL
jgi:hypothetical protein